MNFGSYLRHVFSQNEDKIAIRFGEEEYTYAYINKITDIIADNIAFRKIPRGSRIGVLMERNANAVFVLLGIVKAGCIYAPLSKENPKLRIDRMLKVADINYIITDIMDEKYEGNLIHYSDMFIEKASAFWNEEDYTEKLYTIFTSGTTGFPKTFDITVDAIVNLIKSLSDIYFKDDIDKYNVIGELAELSFDMSQAQLYLALLNGKILDIIPSDIKKNPQKLPSYLSDRKIAHCDITPTVLNIFIKNIERKGIIQKYPLMWTTSGEKLTLNLAKKVIENTNCKIANSYGPSEICVYASVHVLENNNIYLYSDVPIGKPISNTEICLLDKNNNVVRSDQEGEIAISGIGVTDGYINLPEVNERAFVTLNNGKRYYKTGDLGFCSSKDGLLYCIGRIDHQVKYHGMRVELGEIQSSLMTMDGILDCIAYVHKSKTDSDLVLYYISSQEYSKDMLIMHMKQYLPDNLLPNFFVKISTIPTTINGKLDVASLPAYKNVNKINKSDVKVDVEQRKFLKIVKNILEVENISLEDNFYSLGGDSLKFISLMAEIEDNWEVSVLYNDLLRCNSLEDIFIYLKSCEKINKSEISEEKLCKVLMNSFQCDIICAEDENADYPTHNIVQVCEVDRYLEIERLKKAVQETINNIDSLKSSIIKEKGDYYLLMNDSFDDFFEFHSGVPLAIEDIKRYIHSIKYNSKSLIKVLLFENEQKKQKLVINAHHTIFDYISIKIFLRHVFSKYNDLPLSKNKSYLGYLKTQNEDKHVVAKKNFWKNYYADRQGAVYFPMQNNKKITEHIYLSKEIILEHDVVKKIRLLGKQRLLTNFQIVLSIWGLVIAEHTGERDLIIGTFFPGRNNYSLDMIGLFTTCLGVRLQLKDDALSAEYLDYVKQQCELIYEYQDTNIREVFRYLSLKDLAKGELFGVLLNYHSDLSFTETYNDENIRISLEDISMEPNSYPLNISIYEYSNKMRINISYDNSKYDSNYVSDIVAAFMDKVSELEKVLEKC